MSFVLIISLLAFIIGIFAVNHYVITNNSLSTINLSNDIDTTVTYALEKSFTQHLYKLNPYILKFYDSNSHLINEIKFLENHLIVNSTTRKSKQALKQEYIYTIRITAILLQGLISASSIDQDLVREYISKVRYSENLKTIINQFLGSQNDDYQQNIVKLYSALIQIFTDIEQIVNSDATQKETFLFENFKIILIEENSKIKEIEVEES